MRKIDCHERESIVHGTPGIRVSGAQKQHETSCGCEKRTTLWEVGGEVVLCDIYTSQQGQTDCSYADNKECEHYTVL